MLLKHKIFSTFAGFLLPRPEVYLLIAKPFPLV